MNTTSLHIKIEESVKEQAQQIAEDLGLSLSAVMKALLKQFVRTKHLSVGIGEEPSSYMLDSLKESDDEYKKGNTSPSFTNIDESFEWLDN